jgi:site-specific recombinase XerD
MLVAAAAHSRRAKVIVNLGLLDGLRVAEMVWLDVPDLSIDQGHRTLEILRKGGAKQRVPIAPAGAVALDEYIGDRTEGPILVTRTGNRITPDRVFRIIRQVANLAELERPDELSPHSMRHAFITLSLNEDVPLRDVQYAAGHKDPRTTERYDRNRNQLERHPTYRLAAALAT